MAKCGVGGYAENGYGTVENIPGSTSATAEQMRYLQRDSYRGCKRNAVNTPNFDEKFVRNESPNDHYINRTDRFETTVV